MRVVSEIETRLGIGGIPARIDAEGTDLPVGGDRSNQQEQGGQTRKEQQEAQLPATATVFRLFEQGLFLSTPEWEPHPASTLSPADYGACLRRGHSAGGR
jgi:hypothetical protein